MVKVLIHVLTPKDEIPIPYLLALGCWKLHIDLHESASIENGQSDVWFSICFASIFLLLLLLFNCYKWRKEIQIIILLI